MNLASKFDTCELILDDAVDIDDRVLIVTLLELGESLLSSHDCVDANDCRESFELYGVYAESGEAADSVLFDVLSS